MIITQVDIPLSIPSGGAPRSVGVHVSSVLRCIAAESGILKPEYVESLDLVDLSQQAWWERLSPAVQLKISMGMAWDQYYLPTIPDVIAHPGEMELDGIYLTHDGESIDFIHTATHNGYVLAIHEVKLTYKSLKTIGDLSTQWLWTAQTKAYCKAAGTRFCYLHCNAVCGFYAYPIQPQNCIWLIEYSQEELDDNWDLITSYVHHRERQEAKDMMRDTL